MTRTPDNRERAALAGAIADERIAVGDLVEIGLAYKMAEHPPYSGRHTLEPDAATGVRGIVTETCADGSVLVEHGASGTYVHRDRVRLVLGGAAQPSADERRWPDAIERGRRKRGGD